MNVLAEVKAELRQLDASRRQLRRFGLVVGGIFLLLGLVAALRHSPIAAWLQGVGGLLVVLGGVVPRSLRQPYRGWIALSIVLGYFVSRLILTALYYVLLTPIATIVRLTKGDPLDRRLDGRPSYWIERRDQSSPADAEKLY